MIPLGVAHSILNRVNENPSDLQNLLDCNRFLKLEPIFTRLRLRAWYPRKGNQTKSKAISF